MKRLLLALALFSAIPAHATNVPFLAWYARDVNGKALVGAKLYFYITGTVTPKLVYTDESCHMSAGTSVTADAAGRFPRFYMGAFDDCSSPLLYKVVLKTAAGATVWTEDGIAALKTDLSGIVNATSATATAAITGTNTSSGYGVKAVTTAGTGHALEVEADTSTPVSSAIHIVPQDDVPSLRSKGDIWVDAGTGLPSYYDGFLSGQILNTNGNGVVVADGEAANIAGITSTGKGNLPGLAGVGGATLGAPGIRGTGGAGGGYGVNATGTLTYAGVNATGGATAGAEGIIGTGGAGGGVGVYGSGTGAFQGVAGVGGATSGAGVVGIGGGPNGIGVQANGTGSGAAAYMITSGTGYGAIIQADTTTPTKAALHLVPQDRAPSSPAEGDIYYNSATHHLFVYLAAAWAQLD